MRADKSATSRVRRLVIDNSLDVGYHLKVKCLSVIRIVVDEKVKTGNG